MHALQCCRFQRASFFFPITLILYHGNNKASICTLIRRDERCCCCSFERCKLNMAVILVMGDVYHNFRTAEVLCLYQFLRRINVEVFRLLYFFCSMHFLGSLMVMLNHQLLNSPEYVDTMPHSMFESTDSLIPALLPPPNTGQKRQEPDSKRIAIDSRIGKSHLENSRTTGRQVSQT